MSGPIANSTEIESQIFVLQSEADKFIGGLEKQLEEARTHRLTEATQRNLETQIEQARGTYKHLLESKNIQLAAARQAEADELEKNTAQVEANAVAEKEKILHQLATAWIQSGGSLLDFEQESEELYRQEMRRRTIEQMNGGPDQAEMEKARRQGRNMIHDGFNRF